MSNHNFNSKFLIIAAYIVLSLLPIQRLFDFIKTKKAQAATGTLTISSSSTDISGTAIATQFIDSDNTSYLLDPAATGTSLTIAGNAGIGTTNPAAKLHIATNVTTLTGKAALVVDQLENQPILTASASGTAKFVILNSGYVGIGSTVPASALDVNGTISATVFGTSLERNTSDCSTSTCTITANCSSGETVFFGMKSVTSNACDTNYTNCSSYCGVGGANSSCSATSTGSAASVVIYCGKLN